MRKGWTLFFLAALSLISGCHYQGRPGTNWTAGWMSGPAPIPTVSSPPVSLLPPETAGAGAVPKPSDKPQDTVGETQGQDEARKNPHQEEPPPTAGDGVLIKKRMPWISKFLEGLKDANDPQGPCALFEAGKGGDAIVSVKDFGAKGDGLSDDYDALLGAAEHMSRPESNGKTLIFPYGTYRIDRYAIYAYGSEKGNGVEHIRYHDCRDIKIVGCPNADGLKPKIDVKGDFLRKRDWSAELDPANPGKFTVWYSRSNGVIPFYFEKCAGFTLKGLELDGNVDEMSREQGVIEVFGGSGIVSHNACAGYSGNDCPGYTIEEMEIHHFSTDGLTLGGGTPECAAKRDCTLDRNIVINRVKSSRNSRCALGIMEVRGGKVTDSTFEETGYTGNNYGNTPPSCGVDIEPDHFPKESIKKYDLPYENYGFDQKAGDLLFDRCTFQNNLGSQFVTHSPALVEKITIQNSVIRSSPHVHQEGVIAVKAAEVLIKDSFVDTGGGYINTSHWSVLLKNRSGQPVSADEDVSTTIQNVEIWTTGWGIMSTNNQRVLIENSKLIGKHTKPSNAFMPVLQNPSLVFRHNYVFLPREAYVDTPGKWDEKIIIQKVELASNNVYDTDLEGGGRWFVVNFSGAKQVEGEVFCRPGISSFDPSTFRGDHPVAWGKLPGGQTQTASTTEARCGWYRRLPAWGVPPPSGS